MRSFEIPEFLYDEFSGSGNKLKTFIEGFPNAEITWKENFPSTYLKIYLEGQAKARQEGSDPDFLIRSSGAGSLWIETSFDLMEILPFKEIIKRCRQLYKRSEDYTRFARFQRK